jgi:hypothetical protein
MRKKLSLCLYMLLVEVVAMYLVVVPVYAFQVSSSSTGYVRVATAAAVSAYQAVKLPTQAAAIASAVAAAAPSGASVALRVVAGASWPALGVLVGLTLLQIYLDSNKTAAIKAAAATPGAWTVPGVTGSILSVVQDATYVYVIYGDGRVQNGCASATALQLIAQGFYVNQGVALTGPPITAGPYCAQGKPKSSGGAMPVQSAAMPATESQIATYLQTLPAADPNSLAANTTAVGAQSTAQPADQVVSQAATPSDLATTVVPASQVAPTDVVVNPNAQPPAGPLPVQNGTQNTTTTTTTTTTTNPNGSTTTAETQTETAPVQCNAGNHEQRTFGGILQDHMDLWKGSGLLSALTLLKTLTWPTAIPTYSLQSNLLGTFTLDFSAWSGMLTAIRSIIIAIAGFVAYRMIFVGAR